MDLSGIRRVKALDLVVELGDAVSNEIAEDVRASFGTGKQGKTHFIKDERFPGGILHTASAEGEVPNILTSELAKSIQSVGVSRLSWHIQDGVPYGLDQEQGKGYPNAAPRSFMGRMFEIWRQRKFKRFAGDFIRNAIK
jgi:hypothetical protein